MHSLQNCMFGGARPKWSTFLTNIEAFSKLAISCDGSHPHAPWQVHDTSRSTFCDTASEAEYPDQLCSAMARLVYDLAVLEGLEPDKTPEEQAARRNALGTSAARQPRGSRIPRLLPEFQHVESATVQDADLDLSPCIGKVLPDHVLKKTGLLREDSEIARSS